MKFYRLFLILAILTIIVLFFFPRVSAKADVEVKPTATPITTHVLTNEEQIRRFAAMYGVDVTLALAIAQCESQLYAHAKNPGSSAKGLFQFIASSWAGYSKLHWGEIGDPYNAEDNADLGVWVLAHYGTGDWLSSSWCWRG